MTIAEQHRLRLRDAGIPGLMADMKRDLAARGFGIDDHHGPVHGTDELGFTFTLPGIRFAISLRANKTAKLVVTEASPAWRKRLGIKLADWTKTPIPYWQVPAGTRRLYPQIVALLETYCSAPVLSDSKPAPRKVLTIEDIIRFARDNHGQTFHTLSRKRPYRIFWEDDQVVFRPQSGTPFYPDLEHYVAFYNQNRSLKVSDYPKDLWCNSYFVSTVDTLARKTSDLPAPNDAAGDIEILTASASTETERAELIKCRLGQGKFRSGLLKLRGKCYVTGIADSRLLRASHIKPWRNSTNAERLDPHNGLLLTPLYDHLFDQGLISFADDGELLIASNLPPQTLAALKIPPKFKGANLGTKTQTYLVHHRTEFQRRENNGA